METIKRMTLGISLIGLLAGCAHDSGSAAASGATVPTVTTTVPPTTSCASGSGCVTGTGTDPGTTGYATGSTADLTNPGGTGALNTALANIFIKSHPNSPSNVRINLNINRIGTEVIVSYLENGILHQNAWSTVHPYSGKNNNEYNGWILQNSKWIWKGFFQDGNGAVVIIIDRALSTGDGQPGTIIGGSIYYQNFDRTYPSFQDQGDQSMCWQITRGPYDCRSFLSANQVIMSSADTPTTMGPDRHVLYQKLGEFYGLDRNASGLVVN
jgi:hypothetical protein